MGGRPCGGESLGFRSRFWRRERRGHTLGGRSLTHTHGSCRRYSMPTYISLLRYTQQGIMAIKQSPTRLDAAKEAYRRAGGELKAFYLTMGQYDAVAIAELPDDTAGAKLALALGAQGNVRTETMRAFTEQEFRRVVSELP